MIASNMLAPRAWAAVPETRLNHAPPGRRRLRRSHTAV
jgi:hypothetical protein